MKMSRIALLTAGLALVSSACFALPPMFQHANVMNTSPDIPAAQAKVKFGKTDNGNTTIDLVVKHLAEPEKLLPRASTYVVWVSEDRDAAPTNVGALMVDRNRKGTLRTLTPLHTFKLFVTAEASGQAQQPTGTRLIWIDRAES